MWNQNKVVKAALIAILAFSATAWTTEPVHVTVDANSLSVDAGDAEVAEYRYGNVPFKPYVKELFTPNGLNVLLDAPHDHLHHHALMFAVAVDGVNVWEETPTAGRQEHVRFAEIVEAGDGGLSRVGFQEQLDWMAPSGTELLAEERVICVSRMTSPQATVLTWESRLSVPEGKTAVTLSGAHYFGLGMRFIPAMDKGGQFRNADNEPGTVFRGEERLVRSNWCAYTARVDGKDVTAAMFGHPDNPRGRTTWFTMAAPFAYLAATLGLHEEPLKVLEGKPLKLRYMVVLWDRPVESEEINRIYEQYRK